MPALEVVHKDPKLWKKPNEFYPEHFLSEEGGLLPVKDGFMPFSVGEIEKRFYKASNSL